jgi:hypothetical protein
MKLIGIEEHFITQAVASAWALAATPDDSLRFNDGVIGKRLAELGAGVPREAPRELERSVNDLGLRGAMLYGRTRERNLDDKAFWPIFEAASALDVPSSFTRAQHSPIARAFQVVITRRHSRRARGSRRSLWRRRGRR